MVAMQLKRSSLSLSLFLLPSLAHKCECPWLLFLHSCRQARMTKCMLQEYYMPLEKCHPLCQPPIHHVTVHAILQVRHLIFHTLWIIGPFYPIEGYSI